MSIFRAIAVETLDDEFRSYLKRNHAVLQYYQRGPNGWGQFYGEMQDSLLHRFLIAMADRRRIDFEPKLYDPVVIVAKVFNDSGTRTETTSIDTADPGVDPADAIRKRILGFMNKRASP